VTTVVENGHAPFCPKPDDRRDRWGSVVPVDPTPSTPSPDEGTPTVKQLLRWSEALAGIARTGLGFTESLYEQERFEEVLHVAADIRSAIDGNEGRLIKTTGDGVLGLNIGKNAATPIENAAADYLLGLAGVYPHADYVTINISSPNTKNLRELQALLDEKGVVLEVAKTAREWLADKGYDPAFGARPLRRALQRYIEDPVAEEILKGKYPEGSTIKVRVSKKTGELKFSSIPPAKTDGDVGKEEEKKADLLAMLRQENELPTF